MDKRKELIQEVRERIEVRSVTTRARYLTFVREARSESLRYANLEGLSPYLRTHERKRPRVALLTQPADANIDELELDDIAWVRTAVALSGGVAELCARLPVTADGLAASCVSARTRRNAAALSTSIALSRHTFDAIAGLGVHSDAAPGVLIGSLRFGHLPLVFVPPVDAPQGDLLRGDYETTLLLTAFGLLEPVFDLPRDPTLRMPALEGALAALVSRVEMDSPAMCVGHMIDEGAIIRAMVALLSVSASLHRVLALVSVAQAAGIVVEREDMVDLACIVPVLVERAFDTTPLSSAQDLPSPTSVMRALRSAELLESRPSQRPPPPDPLFSGSAKSITRSAMFVEGGSPW
jgi:phosphogluconate dehydratase